MAKVKSALEIALEKSRNIAGYTQEEKERIQDEERLLSILKEFYQGKIDSAGLWQQMRGSKASLLREAQINIINTFGMAMSADDFEKRKQAILALETLKEQQNTAVMEADLHSLGSLLREYRHMQEKAAEDLKRQLEAHPQLRMRPVRTPDGKTVMQMMVSVDEAVKAKLSEFLSEQEEQFNQEFSAIIAELKDAISNP